MPDWAPHIRARLASLRLSPTPENEIVEELSQLSLLRIQNASVFIALRRRDRRPEDSLDSNQPVQL